MWKYLVILLSIGMLLNCHGDNKPVEDTLPPDLVVDYADPDLRNDNGNWLWKGKPFDGYIIEKDSGVIISRVPVVHARENGIAYGWYTNGRKKYERHFVDGNRDGLHLGWYENDTLAFEYHFKDDQYDGLQKTFFKNGSKWQMLHYANGREEGVQKTWNESGRAINNFTVKNGKLYGVIGRFDCMSVQK